MKMSGAGAWEKFPKVDLHRHLEGSIRLETLREIARSYDLDYPIDDLPRFRTMVQMTPDQRSAEALLAKFAVLRHFFRSEEIITRITREAVLDAAADEVRYLELRFNPVALSAHNEFTPAQACRCVQNASALAAVDCGIDVRLIISINRSEPERAHELLDIACDGVKEGITGLDLSGDEVNAAAEPFIDLFDRARSAGLDISVHAGEWTGPENIRFAIEELNATRIGHGIGILDDPDLISLARERGTLFEFCITSNYLTAAIAVKKEHPVLELTRKHGLSTTLNTDDPSIFDVTLSDEFEFAHDHLGLTIEELRAMNLRAARHAFLDDGTRNKLITHLQQKYAENDNLPAKM
ncbi:MAG: adenosine deaminase [bacterium]|nr:adenosine deaminase [bacterium]